MTSWWVKCQRKSVWDEATLCGFGQAVVRLRRALEIPLIQDRRATSGE
jgi:hypothetical protein